MRLIAIGLLLFAAGQHLAFADDNNRYAGTWKLDTAKSHGPMPACLQKGILNISPEIYTGSPKSGAQPATGTGSPTGSCKGVYFFSQSPDGRTLTMTQPQAHPEFKAVFEKQ
jgi:hypothetical protein